MQALVIGEKERAAITAALEKARAKPVPASVLQKIGLTVHVKELALSDRPKDFEPHQLSQFVSIPLGYLCAISFEEQPAGLVRHLSVSIERKGLLPGIPAVEMLAKEFGFREFPPSMGQIWLEEFEPGHKAVNVIELADILTGGNA